MNDISKKWILAIDPGSDKVGFAVVNYDLTHGEKGIVYLSELHRLFKRMCNVSSEAAPQAIVIGNGTAAAAVCRLYNSLEIDIKVQFAEEKNTTYKARARYFQDHPPTGFWRIVPIGLQMPPCPVDDYAALLIGEKFLVENKLVEQGAAEPGKP
ncbi:MAG: crossover junction endodeoxyribonuclease RuvC [Candidatus Riflebacteria bacterium]|jgi:RNase H-fold protein (predicted Holliday junction resolvase)|nr:crossover junction endodeoxyribonuclease RuvC [Candidatus Riflebacteria bacterium]